MRLGACPPPKAGRPKSWRHGFAGGVGFACAPAGRAMNLEDAIRMEQRTEQAATAASEEEEDHDGSPKGVMRAMHSTADAGECERAAARCS